MPQQCKKGCDVFSSSQMGFKNAFLIIKIGFDMNDLKFFYDENAK